MPSTNRCTHEAPGGHKGAKQVSYRSTSTSPMNDMLPHCRWQLRKRAGKLRPADFGQHEWCFLECASALRAAEETSMSLGIREHVLRLLAPDLILGSRSGHRNVKIGELAPLPHGKTKKGAIANNILRLSAAGRRPIGTAAMCDVR